MTDLKDVEMLADGQGTKRHRTHNYGDRRTVSLRMDPELHERMMDLCNDLKIPANTYISGLVEINLKKQEK